MNSDVLYISYVYDNEQKTSDKNLETTWALSTTFNNSCIELVEKKKSPTPHQKKKTSNAPDIALSQTFEWYARNIIKKSKSSTAHNYKTALNRLCTFNGETPPTLKQITPSFIENFQQWLIKQKICKNTIACYMRSLRSLYNYIVKQQRIKNRNPFRNISTQNQQTRKRTINNVDLKRIKDLDLSSNEYLSLCRDVFLFSFYAMGMPFVDIARLRHSNINGNYIIYRRHKTGQPVYVKIEKCISDIINKYESDDRDYIFPILPNNVKDFYKSYNLCLTRYNKSLKTISKKAGIKENLTSYVARHTWANMAYRMTSDINVVSAALGHTSTKTTKIYVNDIINPRLYQANRKIMKKLV